MSAKAERYTRRQGFTKETSFTEQNRRKPLMRYRINDQRIISRFLEGTALWRIFGVTSVEYALNVALRVKRLKGRTPAALGFVYAGPIAKQRRHLQGRNNHHLTPRSRKDQPYYGNAPHNLLLIKIKRHDALHEECEVRTWEEIIFLLARCVQALRGMSLRSILDRASPRSRGKIKCRRAQRYHSHSYGRSFRS